jgi:hypothetical protein
MITDPEVLSFLDGLAEIIAEEILMSKNVQENKGIERAGNIETSQPPRASPF